VVTQPKGVTDPLQLSLDAVVAEWPGVNAKQVFGHRAYVRAGTMFGYLADAGASVKLTAEMDAVGVMARDGVKAVQHAGEKPTKGWATLPLRDEADLDAAVDLMHQAYETVKPRA
jgi:hypothetical protein